MTVPLSLRQHWQLDPDVDFLNHGSFGATPTVVLETLREFQDALERQPIRFLAPERDLESKLDVVRSRVALIVGADPVDVAFVRNATDGVNAVLRSMTICRDDEIVVTNHGYNACNNAARFVAQRARARLRVAMIPFPLSDEDEVIAAIEAEFSPKTKLLLVDHVTSATGLILPIERIVATAHRHGVRVLVDGAHAPGMIPVDLDHIGADYYTANHHKWICAPKASGFLHVRRDRQSEVRPTVISHAANTPRPGRSRFVAEFDWTGTFDPCPLLATPAAIDFLDRLYPGGIDQHTAAIRRLTWEAREAVLETLQISAPSPREMIGALVTIPLPHAADPPTGMVDPLQSRLFDRHRIEVPVFRVAGGGPRVLRFSVQAYNDIDQYRRLANAIAVELG